MRFILHAKSDVKAWVQVQTQQNKTRTQEIHQQIAEREGPGYVSRQEPQQRSGRDEGMPWRCDFCTFVNYSDGVPACEICGVQRRGAQAQQPQSRPGTPQRSASDSFDLSGVHEAAAAAAEEPQQVQQERREQQSLVSHGQKNVARTTSSSSSRIDELFEGSGLEERRELLREILASERAYVDSLRVLVTHFLQPLQREMADGNKIVSKKTLEGIFSNVFQLMTLNVELLRVMELELTNTEQQRAGGRKKSGEDSPGSKGDEDLAIAITNAFKEIIPYFKMYSWYVNNYPNAVNLLKSEQANNKKFAKFLAEQHSHEICKGLDLGAYLIMPVQRLCKYPLLFARLLKETPEENADYNNIKQVTQVVNEITSVVDLDRDRAEKSLRGFEIANFVNLETMAKRMGEEKLTLLEAGRVFRYEWHGTLSRAINKRSSQEQQKPRTMFLFSNVLLITKKGSKGYDARVWMDLNRIILGDLGPSLGAGPSKETEKNSAQDTSPTNASYQSGIGLSWTPKLMAGKGKSSSPTNALASGTGAQFHFSVIHESTGISGSRLSLTRSRSRKAVTETFTFFFPDEQSRAAAHEHIAEAQREMIEIAHTRPNGLEGLTSSASFFNLRSENQNGNLTPSRARRARSLSPPARAAGAQTPASIDESETGSEASSIATESKDGLERKRRPNSAVFARTPQAPPQAPEVTPQRRKRPPAPMKPTENVTEAVPPGKVGCHIRRNSGGLVRPPAPGISRQKSMKKAQTSAQRCPRPKAPTRPRSNSMEDPGNSSRLWTSAPMSHEEEIPVGKSSPIVNVSRINGTERNQPINILSSKPIVVRNRPAAQAAKEVENDFEEGSEEKQKLQKWFE